MLFRSITQIGYGRKSAEKAQAFQAEICSGLDASVSTLKDRSNSSKFNLALSLSTKMLPENTPKTIKLINETIAQAKFSEKDRIANLLQLYLLREEEHLNQSGHIMAMSSAAAGLNTFAWAQENLHGISALKNFKDLLGGDNGMDEALRHLKAISKNISKKIGRAHV